MVTQQSHLIVSIQWHVAKYAALCVALSCVHTAPAAVLTVGRSVADDFTSLTEAWQAAEPGDTIILRQGIYHEELIIGEGEGGTREEPITIKADPAAAMGSVILDGARAIPAHQWTRFVSEHFGVTAEHNIWYTSHDPDRDAQGRELAVSAWPYNLHSGGTQFSIGRARLVRYGTCHLFKDGAELTLVPDRIDAGLMSDQYHADAEETQNHDYISASNPKFLKADQWIWYDSGRTDGSDEDEEPVSHPPELRNRIFVRLPRGERPGNAELAISTKSSLIRINGGHDIIISGLSVVRADHISISVSRSERIKLRDLVVRSFGGGRKFYYGAGIGQYMWDHGSGINLHTSDAEVTGCVVEQGTGKGISVWGAGANSPQRTAIRDNVIRDVGPHPWGGTWAHGRGTAIGIGNLSGALIAGNRVSRVSNCGIWVDGGGADSNIHILHNRFSDCGNWGVFLEAGIADALAAYNIVERSKGGFRVGRDGARCRVIGNTFVDCDRGGYLFTYEGQMGGHENTVAEFVLAGNVFANCAFVGLKVSAHALKSARLFIDHNIWHLRATANPEKSFGDVWGEGEGPGGTPRGGIPFERYRNWLSESENCLAAEQHSALVGAMPAERLQNGEYRTTAPTGQLLSDALLQNLESNRLLTAEERVLLAAG